MHDLIRLAGHASIWVAMSGCTAARNGSQSALHPAGPQSGQIADLWWSFLVVGSAIFVLVMLLLLVGLLRSWRRGTAHPLGPRQGRRLVLLGGVLIPVVVLVGFILASVSVGSRVSAPAPEGALTIEVTGRLWWWEVRYPDRQGGPAVTTANEIHVPVGRPVRLLLTSDNVIHSFWVPALQGKLDLIPGQVNSSWFVADRAGTYRGQCAEYCGTQHALMAFLVVAEPAARFDAWLRRQARPAAVPATSEQARGRELFVSRGCDDCHTIRGTAAQGEKGPDLTHVAGRQTLAAATVPNNRGHLGGWIADPQPIKPGNLMPATLLAADELHALIAYLESLR